MTQATSGIAAVMPSALATGLFVSLCDIQQPSGVFGASGAPDGNYTDVSGLTGIACMKAPPSIKRLTAMEQNSVPTILSVNQSHVLLDAYYPAIQTGYRAVVDSIAYDIKGVESDSQRVMTRLRVELVSL